MNFVLFLTIFCLAITSQSTKTMKQELKGSEHLSKSVFDRDSDWEKLFILFSFKKSLPTGLITCLLPDLSQYESRNVLKMARRACRHGGTFIEKYLRKTKYLFFTDPHYITLRISGLLQNPMVSTYCLTLLREAARHYKKIRGWVILLLIYFWTDHEVERN